VARSAEAVKSGFYERSAAKGEFARVARAPELARAAGIDHAGPIPGISARCSTLRSRVVSCLRANSRKAPPPVAMWKIRPATPYLAMAAGASRLRQRRDYASDPAIACAIALVPCRHCRTGIRRPVPFHTMSRLESFFRTAQPVCQPCRYFEDHFICCRFRPQALIAAFAVCENSFAPTTSTATGNITAPCSAQDFNEPNRLADEVPLGPGTGTEPHPGRHHDRMGHTLPPPESRSTLAARARRAPQLGRDFRSQRRSPQLDRRRLGAPWPQRPLSADASMVRTATGRTLAIPRGCSLRARGAHEASLT